MILFIAILLIWHFDMAWWWYPITFIVWFLTKVVASLMSKEPNAFWDGLIG